MKTWLAIHWDAEGCHIEGPFGDTKEDAVRCVKEGNYEAGGVFTVDLEEIDLTE